MCFLSVSGWNGDHNVEACKTVYEGYTKQQVAATQCRHKSQWQYYLLHVRQPWGGREVEKFSENLCFWDWGFGSFLLKASAVRYLLIPSIDTPLTSRLTLNQPSIGILITSGRHSANYINWLLIKCRQVIGQLSIWMLIEGINQEYWSTLNHGYPKYTNNKSNKSH